MTQMMTVRQAATVANCSANMIKAAILRKELKAKDIGTRERHCFRIAARWLREWLGLPPA